MTPEEISALPYRKCVGVVLWDGAGRVFTGQRFDSELPAWQMPQGGIEAGEDAKTAALRELVEETGVEAGKVEVLAEAPDWISYDLPVEIVPRIWKGRYKGQTQRWVLMRFQGTDADINIETAHPEFSEWRWLEPPKVLTSIVPFKRDVYEQVFKAFDAWL